MCTGGSLSPEPGGRYYNQFKYRVADKRMERNLKQQAKEMHGAVNQHVFRLSVLEVNITPW